MLGSRHKSLNENVINLLKSCHSLCDMKLSLYIVTCMMYTHGSAKKIIVWQRGIMLGCYYTDHVVKFIIDMELYLYHAHTVSILITYISKCMYREDIYIV